MPVLWNFTEMLCLNLNEIKKIGSGEENWTLRQRLEAVEVKV